MRIDYIDRGSELKLLTCEKRLDSKKMTESSKNVEEAFPDMIKDVLINIGDMNDMHEKAVKI